MINPPVREWFPALARWWNALSAAAQGAIVAGVVVAAAVIYYANGGS